MNASPRVRAVCRCRRFGSPRPPCPSRRDPFVARADAEMPRVQVCFVAAPPRYPRAPLRAVVSIRM
eukprot:11181972-Lingulodinium_polyedra.AAC.1